jgi:hypothetical protein
MTNVVDGTDVALGNVYQLAKLAGCLQPDDEQSLGANWLDKVSFWTAYHNSAEAGVMDSLEGMPEWTAWKIYAELGGWQVEMIGSPTDMTSNARKALRHIAYTLASAVVGSSTTVSAA